MAQQNGDANAPVEAQPEGQQVPPASKLESFFAMTKSLILRALIIYFVSSFFRKGTPTTSTSQKSDVAAGPKIHAWNYFENGTMFDLHVWLSENAHEVNFQQKSNLLWLQEDLTYGDWVSGPHRDGLHYHQVTVKASPKLMNNGSVYLHTFVTKSGESPDPNAPNFAKNGLMGHQQKQLNKFKKIRVNRNYNLLASEQEKLAFELAQANLKDTIVSHWHTNLTVNLVVDQTNWAQGAVPPPLDEFVKFSDDGKTYLPIVFVNDYWNLQRDYYPINETTPELPLHLTFHPIGMFKWQLYAAQQMKNKFAGNVLGELMASGGGEVSRNQLNCILQKILKNINF